VKQKGSIPCARAAHAACAHNKLIYTFGGVSAEGALDDMHCFNTGNALTHVFDMIHVDRGGGISFFFVVLNVGLLHRAQLICSNSVNCFD